MLTSNARLLPSSHALQRSFPLSPRVRWEVGAVWSIAAIMPQCLSTLLLLTKPSESDSLWRGWAGLPGLGKSADEVDANARVGGVLLGKDDVLEFREAPTCPADFVACGSYTDGSAHASGFGQLRIHTSGQYDDLLQMRAAGFLEGVLTHKEVKDHHDNVRAWVVEQAKGELHLVESWLATQDEWSSSMASANAASSPLWEQTALVLAQFDGLVEGYASAAAPEAMLSRADLRLVNSIGDVLDLLPALSPKARPDWDSMQAEEMLAAIATSGHCSALIQVTGDLSQLLFAHSSWFVYASMLRTYKHYSFAHRSVYTAAQRTSFSSYPGVLSSLDDFYLMQPSGLAVLQTTNSVLNVSLYDLLTPASLLAWHRVRVANQMATGGEQWSGILQEHNSGTYNNQYMVLDLNRFTPRSPLPADLLWVVEQIPGLVVSADRTQILELGYWPSYNVPYFREVYDRSGYKELMEAHSGRGTTFASALSGLDYQMAPRAKIFRRDAKVTDMESLKRIMRSNGWPLDDYSGGSPFGAICSRGDLSATHPVAAGCYDTKVSSWEMARHLEAHAVNGPTTQGHPPFTWTQFPNVTHQGLPNVFDNDFEKQVPSWEQWESQHVRAEGTL